MSGDFAKQSLSDKLAKLNNSQQSIQTLSNWCIFHRKRASQIVSIWEKNFHDAPKHKKLPLLYLANDILQNSRRKGPEFINEFWKTLPPALSYMIDNGDSSSKSSSLRLIDIWEERKVFGSFTENLREIVMGKKSHSKDKKSSEPSGPFEKLNAALAAVQDMASEEELSIKKSQSLISELESIEADTDARVASGELGAVADDLTRQQGQLARTSTQLEGCEKKRNDLVNLLRETLRSQESKLERIQNQIQLVQTHAENALNLRHRLLASKGGEDDSHKFHIGSHEDDNVELENNANGGMSGDDDAVYNTEVGNRVNSERNDIENSGEISPTENNSQSKQQEQQEEEDLYSPSLHSFSSPVPPFPSSYTSPPSVEISKLGNDPIDLESKKRSEAAELTAKLTASASSVAMLSSVLSSLVQESENGTASLGSVLGDLAASGLPDNKRQKIDDFSSNATSMQSDSSSFQNHSAPNSHFVPPENQLPHSPFYSAPSQSHNQNQGLGQVPVQGQNQGLGQVPAQGQNQGPGFSHMELGAPPLFEPYGSQPMANISQPMMMPHQMNAGMPPAFGLPPGFAIPPNFPAAGFYTAPLPPPPAPRPP